MDSGAWLKIMLDVHSCDDSSVSCGGYAIAV